MSFNHYSVLFLFWGGVVLAQSTDQNAEKEIVYQDPINDNTIIGQKDFVYGLMSLAGYTVDEIIVYQNLPNHAKIFRVIYNEESQSGFIFIRWDKKKKENYVKRSTTILRSQKKSCDNKQIKKSLMLKTLHYRHQIKKK